MRVRIERAGEVFEFERRPMRRSRFLALCAIAAAALYVGMVVAVTALCGLPGLIAVAVVTLFIAMGCLMAL